MRYLFAPIPVTGHVNPGLPIARELVRRGHDVRWYSSLRFKRTIETIGARWVPLRQALPIDDQLRDDFENLFLEFTRGALTDLEAELHREAADVIVGDNGSAVVEAVHRKFGIPWAVYGMSVMTMSSRDTAPFGLALSPSASLPLRRSIFDFAKDASLYLQSGVPSFDDPRTDLPSNVHYIGAPIPEPPAGWPAIRALAEQNALVIVTTGSKNPEEVGIDPLPSNVRVERFIPYAHLMPHVDLLLTNGGYGSIQIALANGVPVVVIGKTEEKPEIANRVNWSGVGIGLKVRIPTETQIRNAVQTVITTPTYAARAEAMRYELSGLDAARIGADLLEELGSSRGEEDEALERSA
jgi:UDP:flavonoid glycosyltransferase YjiC (YdhE family)